MKNFKTVLKESSSFFYPKFSVKKFGIKELTRACENAGLDNMKIEEIRYLGFTKDRNHAFGVMSNDDGEYFVSRGYVFLNREGVIACDFEGVTAYNGSDEEKAKITLKRLKT